jgi:neprilysin
MRLSLKIFYFIFLFLFNFQIDQTDFGLNIEYLLKGIENPIVKAYLDYQVDVAVQLGADRKRAEKEMMDALEFEIGLAKVNINV